MHSDPNFSRRRRASKNERPLTHLHTLLDARFREHDSGEIAQVSAHEGDGEASHCSAIGVTPSAGMVPAPPFRAMLVSS
jgi:hypothetical protein